ncbi:MAG: hypothetical protein M1820_010161 [Bogoriella megaspora]|nr:MAG: hypothetical protein M1820_010161 [Bogoriella megaspora]
MATQTVMMPVVPQVGPGYQASYAIPSQYQTQYTPVGTPQNISPTSPRDISQIHHTHLHSRQPRPQKCPLYVPAVLRPTEKPIRQPMTPPSSLAGSFDSSRSPAARRASIEGSSLVREVAVDWDNLAQQKVTGLPTRNHWKSESFLHESEEITRNQAREKKGTFNKWLKL